ncbi:MAG: DNA polymerase III subunit delta [Patescibacteria group bacterium]|jgi:DNA polymerase-3 subunit delta
MIFFLWGPDTFRSRQKLKEIKEKFVKELDKSSLNIEILKGDTLETPEFEKAVSTPPFLAKKRLVIIEDLISKNKGQKIQKEILEALDKNGLKDTIIVFWESGLDGGKSRSKISQKRSNLLFSRLKKEKYAQEFDLLTEQEVCRFASEQIKKRGGKIEPSALNLLADLTGNDLWQLNSEIDKLLAFRPNQLITVADVNELVKNKLEADIFKLTDALGQKNKKLALKLISDQLRGGTSPTELLTKITWQFKNLLLVKSFMESHGSGYSSSRLTYTLGLHPFVIKKTMAQAHFHQLPTLKKIYQNLITIDYKIKTSQIDPEVLFDLLVIKT